MSPFRVRRESLADDALVVVRGGRLELERLRRDATMSFARFGEYGVSVLAIPDEAALDDIARTTLVKDSVLTLMTVGAIRAIDLDLRPTFRRPHYTIMLPDLDADLLRLITCDNVIRENKHHQPPEAQR